MKFKFALFNSITIKKRQLLENVLSLSLVQGTNLLLPLITLPYLVRVLGADKYGLIAFAQAFTQYFVVITEYGFVHTAPRRVSVHRDNDVVLHEIFNSIMIIKILLLLASFIICFLIIICTPRFRYDANIYAISFLIVLGNVLFPVWFFQGMEKMKYITLLNLISKIFFTISIFVLIKNTSDYIYVPLLNSLGLILTGVISFFIITQKMDIKLKIPSKQYVFEELKEGWHVFLGMFSVNLFSSTNVVILGIFANNTIVGYFKAGDTLIRSVIGLLQPINNALYPHISRLAISSKEQATNLIRKLLLGYGSLSFFISFILFFFATDIVHIAFGRQYTETITVVKILSPLPLIIGINSILGLQGLLAFGYNKLFSRTVMFSAILNLLLAFVLTPLYKHIGISYSLLFTEIFTLIFVSYIIKIYAKNSPLYNWTVK